MSTTGGDILGFGNADNAVTSRPARAIVRGDTDTWAKDCSSPDADDGTAWPADVFNDLLAQVRVALRSSSIVLDGGDDMLWRALQSIGIRYAVDTGAASALVVTNAVPVAAYGAGGLTLLVKVVADATGATTINVDGLGAKSIKWPDNTALAANDIKAGAIILISYDGAKFQLLARMNGGGAAAAAFVPGCIYDYGAETAPAGTLECDGSAVSRTTYSRLFDIIGTTWGAGNGTTTFNLPDFRNKFRKSWDHTAGRDPDSGLRTASAAGGATGNHVGTLQAGAAGAIAISGGSFQINDLQMYGAPFSPQTTPPGPTGWYGLNWRAINGLATPDPGTTLQIPSPEAYNAIGTIPSIRGTMTINANSGAAETRPANANVLTVIAY